jgi:[acyl-carrier-protein] S-malonyltransferase
MGKALAEASPAARAVYARADEALGAPLSKLCFEGPLEELTLTTNTQPALVATSAAVVAAIRERWPDLREPAFAAGHSLGEYSALVAAGAIALEAAVRLCRLRGQAMQEAVPAGEGSMGAVMGMDAAGVEALCAEAAQGEVLSPANYNSPGQIVIAGHAAAVAGAKELASKRGGKVTTLKVSAPFHCALMRPAAERVAAELGRTPIAAPRFPILANVDAAPNADPARVPDLLTRQIDRPVRWAEIVERMAAAGVTRALEIGPGKVLGGLVKRIDKRITVLNVGDPEGVEKVGAFLKEEG